MRKLLSALVLAVSVMMVSQAANAAIVLEGSVGKGGEVKPDARVLPTNLMVAPGLSFAIIKLQLGLVADIPDVENSKFDIGLRPMLTISPPILPLYARLILAINNLSDSEKAPRSVAYGGAVGLGISLAGIGVFAEAGLLPRSVASQFRWVLEGRAGVSLEF